MLKYFLYSFFFFSGFGKAQLVYTSDLYSLNRDSPLAPVKKNTVISLKKEDKKYIVEFTRENKTSGISSWKKTVQSKLAILDSLKRGKYSKEIGFIDLSIYPVSDFDDFFIYLPKDQTLINNHNQSLSLSDAISHRYGSMDNLKEEISKEKMDYSFEEALNFLKNDGVTYQKLFPEDSSGIKNIFIRDLEKVIPVNAFQKERIMSFSFADKPEKEPVRDRYHVYIGSRDATDFLMALFIDQDIYKYIEYSLKNGIIRRKVNDYLYTIYTKENVPEQSYEDFLKNKIAHQ